MKETSAHILVVDDELDILRALKIYLETDSFQVTTAQDGLEAMNLLKQDTNQFDLVLLDIMMPKLDGLTVLEKIRSNSNLPVILLTAKGEDPDKILGLNSGADDYITKPFNPLELLARVKAQLRRFNNLGGRPTSDETSQLISYQGLVLDQSSHQVNLDGQEIKLTPTEFKILQLLLQNPGQVFSSEAIYEKVWQAPSLGADGTVAVHIRHLREKLEIDPNNPRLLTVVWGQGYKLN